VALKTAEASVGVGLGLTGLVYAIYNSTMPTISDVRSIEADNRDLQKSRRTATVLSAILVGGVGLITGDATAYVIGGVAIVGMDWLYRHADQVSPLTGTATPTLSLADLNAQSPDTPSDYVYVDASI
jgi:hypothetical protein